MLLLNENIRIKLIGLLFIKELKLDSNCLIDILKQIYPLFLFNINNIDNENMNIFNNLSDIFNSINEYEYDFGNNNKVSIIPKPPIDNENIPKLCHIKIKSRESMNEYFNPEETISNNIQIKDNIINENIKKKEIYIYYGSTTCNCFVYEDDNIKLIHLNNNEKDEYLNSIFFSPYSNNIICGYCPHYKYNKTNFIYNYIKLIGYKYSYLKENKILDNYEYNIINDYDIPKIELSYNNKIIKISLDTIIYEIFKEIKSNLDRIFQYKKDEIININLIIPSFLLNEQKKCIKNNAEKANIYIDKFIERSIFILNRNIKIIKNNSIILVFHFGGYSLELTLLKYDNEIKIIKNEYDINIGGNNFNKNLLKYINEKSKYKLNNNQIEILKHKCEETKYICQNQISYIDCDFIDDLSISPFQFNEINNDIYEKINKRIIQFINNTNPNIIILSGKSCKIKRIKEIINKILPNITLL